MDKQSIANALNEMAVVMELTDENPFKVRAYENAARIVETLDDLEERIQAGTLTEIKGIGANLAAHITELHKTGKISDHEKLKSSVPAGLFEVLKIPNLGPKRVKFLWKELGVKQIGDLELICRAGGLRLQKGWGKKLEEKILAGIKYLKRNIGAHLQSHALVAAYEVYDQLAKCKATRRIEIAGSLRRKKETINDIDIVASSDRPKELMKRFVSLAEVEKIELHGETKSTILLKSGMSCDLRVVSDAEFPYALHHFTGSKEHNVAMRGLAIKRGMKMNEYGLFKTDGGKETPVKCRDEAEIFFKLGMDFIPPELRENAGELEAAAEHKLPDLVNIEDIKGVLHVHSNYSDGVNSLEEMALAAKKMGFTYVGISDHSRSAPYAGGLSIEKVKEQWKEIDALNKKLKGVTLLKGIESDILKDGSLDYPDDILAGFDFVIASIHSRFGMTQEEMTRRIVKAVTNRYTTILGHPTGRLLLSREGYQVDMKQVIDAAAEHGTAIEINCNPYRLDLDWRHCHYAKSKGVQIALCPDAHVTDNLADIMFGLGIARKGWLEKGDVLNAKPLASFLKFKRGK